jgi:hypothetical protein
VNEINQTATVLSLATLIAMTGSEDVGTPPRQRGLVYSHGGAACWLKSRAQCEAACALDQGAECYQDDGEVYLANSSSPGPNSNFPSTKLQLHEKENFHE